MKHGPRVCVVGSINMDLVTTTKKIPTQGETVLGEKFETYPGGKGANQAIAAARLGADVTMIGAVGDDAFGADLLKHFESESIRSEGLQVIPDMSTGIATIILSEHDNRIIVAAGANQMVTPKVVESAQDILLSSDMILVQFETPLETVKYTVEFASKHDIPVIVNPAPFQEMPKEILEKAAYITPNELEYAGISSMAHVDVSKDKMIITKGDQGVAYTDAAGEAQLIPAYSVHVKDTTGAGDTFNGALATELASGKTLAEAIDFANAAAALSVQAIGAQGGMPTREAVIDFINENMRRKLT